MDPITVHLDTPPCPSASSEPIRFGVPFAPGELPGYQTLGLLDAHGRSLPTQALTTACWPDGSVRWIRVDTLIDTSDQDTRSLTLVSRHGTDEHGNPHCTMSDAGPRIDTGALSIQVDPHRLAWQPLDDSQSPTHIGATRVELKDANGNDCVSVVDHWEVVDDGPVALTLRAQGHWLQTDQSPLANFVCRLRFYRNSKTVGIEIRHHNPRRARHPGGLWDLGDAGSIHFESLAIRLNVDQQTSRTLSVNPQSSPLQVSPSGSVRLYQDSSGGAQWNSLNHVNADGDITPQFKGYVVEHGESITDRGDRAEPTLALTCSTLCYAVSMPEFWQTFPSALTIHDDAVLAELFPAHAGGPYELQGGERKTLRVFFNYGGDDDLSWTHQPTLAYLSPEVYQQAEAYPWFKAHAHNDALDTLVRQGLDDDTGFFSKRERIDEYGWRHFGEVFADHETLYQPEGEPALISHYNNQYDAVYGFSRQFALTGDRRWFALMDDLARHVTDIDIYHTQEDRCEYNNGLFWHTDHYLPAHTATHRTFTRHNSTSSTPGQTGGGPANEHCYTTGLLYHYWMTGNTDSRDSVVDLAEWMVNLHEGQGGLLEQIQAIKKVDLPHLKGLLKGTHPFSHRYPFTRGTGNYLNALLDAWLATEDPDWLTRAEKVIRGCINPADDLDKRRLGDVESNWSYLILLTSLTKYLSIKLQASDLDHNYAYALNSFRHYAHWMVKHEKPFLTDPDQLEFPNDTWIAQDIRKAMLLYQAIQFDPDMAHRYREKADEWFGYVTDQLMQSREARFSRILVILMQNYGPHHFTRPLQKHAEPHWESTQEKPPVLTLTKLAIRMAQRLSKGLVTFRPSREKAWLDTRLNRP